MWPRFINAALGIWLMASSAVLGYAAAAQTVDRIVGPLIATFAIIAIWQPTRPLRWVNSCAGLFLIATPWLFGYGAFGAAGDVLATMSQTVVGVAVALLACIKGTISQRFGHGWRTLWPPTRADGSPHQRELYDA